jgi:hypothetical protein
MPILRRTRKQKFKDLMRNRTTVEQGLTFKQIFCEVYSDLVEKHASKNRNYDTGQVYDYNDDPSYEGKAIYLRRMMKQVRKTDDDFRWLSIMPVKRNEVNKTTGKKVRPYLEYRYINIKALETPELLDQVNKIWLKHAKGCFRGLQKKQQILRDIAEKNSTPEGQRQYNMMQDVAVNSILLEVDFLRGRNGNVEIDKMVSELKRKGRLPQAYKTDHNRIKEILKAEVINKQALVRLLSELPCTIANDAIKQKQEIRKLMKDTIEVYCDKKEIEKEQAMKAKQYDWESLEYR